LAYTRIELRDKVRRLGTSPTVSDTQSVERERQALASHIATLTNLQNAANVPDHDIAPSQISHYNVDNSDDLEPSDEDTPTTSGPSHLPAERNAIPVEEQQVFLPFNGSLAEVEIQLRKNQASRLLRLLREFIVDKSFQYSHIIRAAPRKEVRTRARADIQQLVNKISLHARMYNHCRSRLVALDCDADTLNMFQRLKKDDLNASTAILNPNMPGSTNIRLSWIWHNSHIRTGITAFPGPGPSPSPSPGPGPGVADRFWECTPALQLFVPIALNFLDSQASTLASLAGSEK
jgi:hypothetical protein